MVLIVTTSFNHQSRFFTTVSASASPEKDLSMSYATPRKVNTHPIPLNAVQAKRGIGVIIPVGADHRDVMVNEHVALLTRLLVDVSEDSLAAWRVVVAVGGKNEVTTVVAHVDTLRVEEWSVC